MTLEILANHNATVSPLSLTEQTTVYGCVHLEVTDFERAIAFWQGVVGLKPRRLGAVAELGTAWRTLIVLHPCAKVAAQEGFDGLHHLAIHVPCQAEFSRIFRRLLGKNVEVEATDRVIAKSLYFTDPDGLGVEVTLETPERRRTELDAGSRFAATGVSDRPLGPPLPLDVEWELAQVCDLAAVAPVSDLAYIGHLHLDVSGLETDYAFFKALGFRENRFLPDNGFGDLSAGGEFTHRLALQVRRDGVRRPAPNGMARMREFTLYVRDDCRLPVYQDSSADGESVDLRDGICLQAPGNALVRIFSHSRGVEDAAPGIPRSSGYHGSVRRVPPQALPPGE